MIVRRDPSWRWSREMERVDLVVCQSARPREKADHLESVSWKRIRGSGDLFVSISRPLSRGRRGNSRRRCGRRRRRAEVEKGRAKSGGWHDAAGVPRARGKCTVVDVNPPTRRRGAPVRPHHGASARAAESHRRPAWRRPPASRGLPWLDDPTGCRLPRGQPGWSSGGKIPRERPARSVGNRAQEKTSERSATKRYRRRAGWNPILATVLLRSFRIFFWMKMTTARRWRRFFFFFSFSRRRTRSRAPIEIFLGR